MNEEQTPKSEESQQPQEDETIQFAGYAGFWKRLAAVIIDSLILMPVILIVFELFGFSYNTARPWDIPLAIRLAIIAVSILYNSGLEASAFQGSIGKLVLRIKVTDIYGDRIIFGRALIRDAAKILSELLFFVGYLMIAITPRKQGLHDMIAGCAVINRG